jgi:hypothetical protein
VRFSLQMAGTPLWLTAKKAGRYVKLVRDSASQKWRERWSINYNFDLPSGSIGILENGTIAAGVTDQGIQILDGEHGSAVVTISFLASGEWAAATPSGLFDGRSLYSARFAFRLENQLFPLDLFSGIQRDGLVRDLLARQRPAGPPLKLTSRDFPPTVEIKLDSVGTRQNQPTAWVSLSASEPGGGIRGLRILQNDTPVDDFVPDDDSRASIRRQAAISLVHGDNEIAAIASGERSSSRADRVTVVNNNPHQKKPNLYITVFGITDYSASDLNTIAFPERDAVSIAQFFKAQEGGIYGSVVVDTVLGKKATRDAMRAALQKLQQRPTKDDVVLLYLAGHGYAIGQQFYFLPYDFQPHVPYNDAVKNQSLAGADLTASLRLSPAVKTMLVIDACQSGTLSASLFPLGARSVGDEWGVIEELNRSTGAFVVAAATDTAFEDKDLGHGLLSYATLAGLGAYADHTPQVYNGAVNTFGLLAHLESAVPELSKSGVPLIMPKLGAPVEPAHSPGVDPWWRSIASTAPAPLANAGAPESLMPVERMAD